MPEAAEPKETNRDSYQDINDSIHLGFWGIELEPCRAEALPIGAKEGEVLKDCRMRRQKDYDSYSRCAVVVTLYMYTSSTEEGEFLCEGLKIDWMDDQETNLVFDLGTHEIGTYESEDEDEDADSEYVEIPPERSVQVRYMAKMALAAIAPF